MYLHWGVSCFKRLMMLLANLSLASISVLSFQVMLHLRQGNVTFNTQENPIKQVHLEEKEFR
ncbi:CLUMA_CG005953, isoform A [Clunio marinus]|uniref:CLUMA_CG005953, isoform A n=1 Tax=Clunio marinus TaxID=568069 RepID=A0A1J1HYG2_9DIPT|nr:CLUMA_CG005953, isoform A [Clunio marinus]